MPDFILSSRAEDDLRSIGRYTIRKHSVEQFHAYNDQLDQAFDEVAQDPFRILSKGRDDLLKGCRFYRVQHHYLVYRVKDGRVEIGRILHENMNFEDHISEEIFE